jgi:hypothetical protein
MGRALRARSSRARIPTSESSHAPAANGAKRMSAGPAARQATVTSRKFRFESPRNSFIVALSSWGNVE